MVHFHLGKALAATPARHTEAADAFRIALARGLPSAEKKEAEAYLAGVR